MRRWRGYLGTPGSAAQAPPRLAFEVSVRVSSMDSNVRDLHRTTNTRVDRVRPIDMLPMEAFRERSFYRIAAPDWANEVMVEIQATMPEGATIQQVPEMLRTLLEDRFGLVSHREARSMDAYELLVAEGGVTVKEVAPLDESEKEVHLDPMGSGRESPGFSRPGPARRGPGHEKSRHSRPDPRLHEPRYIPPLTLIVWPVT